MQATVTLVPRKGSAAALMRQRPQADDAVGSFWLKVKLAWSIFFPPQQRPSRGLLPGGLSPKDLGRQRLSMILVADRCGLSPSSIVAMQHSTIAALQDCMDLRDLQDANLKFTMTREGGTTYSMAVPILQPGPYAEDGSVVPSRDAWWGPPAASYAEEEDEEEDEDEGCGHWEEGHGEVEPEYSYSGHGEQCGEQWHVERCDEQHRHHEPQSEPQAQAQPQHHDHVSSAASGEPCAQEH